MKFFYLFDLSKKGGFFLPFPTPKNTYRGLILSIGLLHIFDLLKKGWFSLPFLAIIDDILQNGKAFLRVHYRKYC